MRARRVDANRANLLGRDTIPTGLVFRLPKVEVREAAGVVGYPHLVATYRKVYTCDEIFTRGEYLLRNP
jgi:hypothetical protein